MIAGIIGSLIATIIWAIAGLFVTNKLRLKIKGFFVSALDVGVSNMFASEQDDDFIKDLNTELSTASYIRLYFARGRFLDKEPLRALYYMDNISFKILLPDTNSSEGAKWLEIGMDNMVTLDAFKDSIAATISQMESRNRNNIIMRYYSSLPIGKIILTEKVAYFSPYVKGDYADTVQICKYNANTLMYKWLERYFNAQWIAAEA